MDDISLREFRSLDAASDPDRYIRALEAFDGIAQIQELKNIARQRAGLAPGQRVLDAGCGFGLETLRLAGKVAPGGAATGIDKSAAFIAEAERRARQAGQAITFLEGDALDLPFEADSFEHIHSERLLIYLDAPEMALAEMARVAAPGATLAVIEPDFSTTTINLPDRDAVRRAIAHEVATAVVQSWLPGRLPAMLADLGFTNVQLDTRVAIFPQDLGAHYFAAVGAHAAAAGSLTPAELEEWQTGLAALAHAGRLFGTVGYFLFTARL